MFGLINRHTEQHCPGIILSKTQLVTDAIEADNSVGINADIEQWISSQMEIDFLIAEITFGLRTNRL